MAAGFMSIALLAGGDPAAAVAIAAADDDGHHFIDVTEAAGLGPEVIGTGIARVCFADLNNDGWPDVVVNRVRVFLNEPATDVE